MSRTSLTRGGSLLSRPSSTVGCCSVMPPCLGNKASKVVAVDVDYDYYYDPIYRSSARLRIRSLQRFRDNQRLSYLRAESLPFQPLTMALLPLLPSSAGGSTVADKLLPSLGKFSPPPPRHPSFFAQHIIRRCSRTREQYCRRSQRTIGGIAISIGSGAVFPSSSRAVRKTDGGAVGKLTKCSTTVVVH